MWSIISIGRLKFRENYTIDFCGWLKLQIVPFDIKINSKIHVLNLIYKSLYEVKFR
jgi:hypothetical protein